jgi:hypothetical protein
MKSYCIVQRQCGERTANISKQRLEIEGGKELFIFYNQSFHQMMKEIIQHESLKEYEYVLMVDGDVILKNGILPALHSKMDFINDKIIVHNSLGYNKFLSEFRFSATHLYSQTGLMKIREITSSRDTFAGKEYFQAKRPESFLLELGMEDKWFWLNDRIFTGYEDFEQSYVDIFRKGVMFAQKHFYYYKKYWDFWVTSSRLDSDFEILLKGFAFGMLNPNVDFLNKALVEDVWSNIANSNKFHKNELNDISIFDQIESKISLHKKLLRSRTHRVYKHDL